MMAMMAGDPATRVLVWHNPHGEDDGIKARFAEGESVSA